jgi:hypothetical protein
MIPLPEGATENLERFQRAHAAGGMAREARMTDVENVARVAGMVAGIGVFSALRRQSRQSILVGLLLAAVISAIAFRTLAIRDLPAWIFVAAGAFGLFRIWKAW